MENSINLIHSKALIQTSTDKKLFAKINGDWKEQNNVMYKSEYHLPSLEEGNNGDYFAKYYRRYNFIKYSENFEQYPWTIFNCTLNKESLFKFPYNDCQKVKGLNELGEHFLTYEFYSDANTPYTFSIFARIGDLSKIQLVLMDYNGERGIKAKFDLSDGTDSYEIFGDQSKILNANCSIELYDEVLNVYRISVTGKFVASIALKARVQMLNNNYEEIFSEPNNTFGLYINGAQISKSLNVEPYLYSKGKYASALSFDKLYKKVNNVWEETSNNLFYLTKEPTEDLGINGDIAVMDSILRLYPFIKAGNTENVARLDRPLGFMYYDNKEGYWYIKTNKSLKRVKVGKIGNEDVIRTFYSDCRLMLDAKEVDKKALAMAITLNQQTYHTYNRYGIISKRPGFNTGGNTNLWMKYTRYSRTR